MEIKIKTEYIKLQQLLKLANISTNGSDIKFYLQENDITLNGQKVTERGKKVYKGDVVCVEGYDKIVVC